MPHRFHIDFETFVALTAAIAATACGPKEPPATAAQSPAQGSGQFDSTAGGAVVEVPEPSVAQPELVEEAPAVVEVAYARCNNDVGEVSCDFAAPDRFGPMCEGFRGTCELLRDGHGYRPRVAAAIARCWEQKGRAVCNIRVRKECIRAALDEACADPEFHEFCESAVRRCRKRGSPAAFSADECVRTLSSIHGDDLDWARDAMGSPSAEGCKLMFPVF